MYLGYITTRSVPFGDHLAPAKQPGGAFKGQVPKRSLDGLYEWPKSQLVGWVGVGVPCHDTVNRSMRSGLEECLETNEIPYEIVYHGLLTLRRECLRQGHGRIGVDRRILAADPVRRGV